jgi:hypothetical protein
MPVTPPRNTFIIDKLIKTQSVVGVPVSISNLTEMLNYPTQFF